MIKDIVENFILEIQTEENQYKVYEFIDPYLYKVKLFLFILFFLVCSNTFFLIILMSRVQIENRLNLKII